MPGQAHWSKFSLAVSSWEHTERHLSATLIFHRGISGKARTAPADESPARVAERPVGLVLAEHELAQLLQGIARAAAFRLPFRLTVLDFLVHRLTSGSKKEAQGGEAFHANLPLPSGGNCGGEGAEENGRWSCHGQAPQQISPSYPPHIHIPAFNAPPRLLTVQSPVHISWICLAHAVSRQLPRAILVMHTNTTHTQYRKS